MGEDGSPPVDAGRVGRLVDRTARVPPDLVGLVVVGAALRLYRLGAESLWLDEAISVGVASERSVTALVTEFPLLDPHPPLYYVVLRLWVTVAGTSEVAVRAPSVVAGVATIPLLYGLTARLFDRPTAALATAFLAVSPFQIWYAQEARMYAFAVLFGVASTYALVRLLESPDPRWLGAYAVTTALFGYTHVFALFVIAAQTVFLAWRTAARRVSRRAGPEASHSVAAAGDGSAPPLAPPATRWITAQAAAFGLLSPWLAVLAWRTVLGGGEGVGIVDWIARPGLETLWQVATLFTFGFARGDVPYWSLTAPPWPLLLLAGACFGLAFVRPWTRPAGLGTDGSGRETDDDGRRPPRTAPWSHRLPVGRERAAVGLCALWLVGPVAAAYLVSVALVPVFVHRNLIVAAPAALPLLSRGVLALPRPPAQYLVAALLVAGMVIPLPGFYTADQKEQWDEGAAYVEAAAGPDDVVLLVPEYLSYPFGYYYDGAAAVAALRPEVTDQALAAAVDGHRAVYLVTRDTGGRDRPAFRRRVARATDGSVGEAREFNDVLVYRVTRDDSE